MKFNSFKEMVTYLVKEGKLQTIKQYYNWEDESLDGFIHPNVSQYDRVGNYLFHIFFEFTLVHSEELSPENQKEKDFELEFFMDKEEVKIKYKTRILDLSKNIDDWDSFEFVQQEDLSLDDFLQPFLNTHISKDITITNL